MPSKSKPAWRQLSPNDIPALFTISEHIHPGLPESIEVFAERVNLFPEGCLALVSTSPDANEELLGYAISHPILHRQPPALDSLLGQICEDPKQYYIHDFAVLPEVRGGGLAKEGVKRLLDVGRRFESTCLVSVYGTGSFWEKFGFVKGDLEEDLREKLEGYGEGAVFLERRNEGILGMGQL
ncbi:acyl-CoA N-acyltransferase [Lophiotrema nucula]|uniref:Acyl-CoA N-acyltransferase n=1 Tax=Lophiotrema nucula TaxID=690887 RepID=A0A6A5YPK7_9PLEO|nr:acyl-CoA N-acyltransferase [Lophiotrema nucula]